MSGDDSHTAGLCFRISVTQISDPGLMKRNPEKMIQALLMHNNIIQKAKIKVRVGSNDSRVHATGCFRHAGEAGKSNGQVGCIFSHVRLHSPLLWTTSLVFRTLATQQSRRATLSPSFLRSLEMQSSSVCR